MVSGLQQRWGGPWNTPQLLAAEHILLLLANSQIYMQVHPKSPEGGKPGGLYQVMSHLTSVSHQLWQ